MTLQQFIEVNNIRCHSRRVIENPNMPDFDGSHWKVIMTFRVEVSAFAHEVLQKAPERTMTLYFSKGYGHGGTEPSAEEVLECLHSDAYIADCCPTFDDYCSELGYDNDSRRAERQYNAVVAQALQVQSWLGDVYNDFLECEED